MASWELQFVRNARYFAEERKRTEVSRPKTCQYSPTELCTVLRLAPRSLRGHIIRKLCCCSVPHNRELEICQQHANPWHTNQDIVHQGPEAEVWHSWWIEAITGEFRFSRNLCNSV